MRYRFLERFVLPAFAILSAACPGLVGNGVLESEVRTVEAFSSVTNVGPVNVHLTVAANQFPTQKPTHSTTQGEVTLTLSGDENLLSHVHTRVKQGQLSIDMEEYIVRMVHPLEIVATTSEVSSVTILGSGDMNLTGARGESLSLNIVGSGNILNTETVVESLTAKTVGSGSIHLDGEANSLTVEISGSGDVQARPLVSTSAVVRTFGSGDVQVCATETLEAAIHGSGDIDYYCDPSDVKTSTRGAGEIRGHSSQSAD